MRRPDGHAVSYCTLYELQDLFNLVNYIELHEIKRILEEALVRISGDYTALFTLKD
jgi:hypothetical protein